MLTIEHLFINLLKLLYLDFLNIKEEFKSVIDESLKNNLENKMTVRV